MVLTSSDSSRWSGWQWVDVLLDVNPEAADFRCPLSHVVMFDPVIAEDGCTYERLAIERWFESNDTSPMVRDTIKTDDGAISNVFKKIGKELRPNQERKAALDRLIRDYSHGDAFPVEPEVVQWDSHGLQGLLQEARSVTLVSPQAVVPPPAQHPRAVADMTSDLMNMFKVLDPLRGELQTLVNLTPPKVCNTASHTARAAARAANTARAANIAHNDVARAANIARAEDVHYLTVAWVAVSADRGHRRRKRGQVDRFGAAHPHAA